MDNFYSDFTSDEEVVVAYFLSFFCFFTRRLTKPHAKPALQSSALPIELSPILNRNLSLTVLTNCKLKPPSYYPFFSLGFSSSPGNYEGCQRSEWNYHVSTWARSARIVALITNLYICQEIRVVPSHFLGSFEHHLYCSLASNCQQFIHRAVARTHKKWISKLVRPNKAPAVVLHHFVYWVQFW